MSALPDPAVSSIAERSVGLGDIQGVMRASHLGERPAAATVRTGIAELDALTGGWPRGALSEICGPASSGRSSVLLSLMAQMTRAGEVCALVDAGDCFDPHSAAAAGVELGRLLWVRCSNNQSSAVSRQSSAPHQIPAVRKSAIGNHRSEMAPLEQTLKATDLLLQGGGFGLVAVDLGDIPPAAARRVPLTSWFRFCRAVENTATVLLVLEQEPYAKTCASVVVRLSAVGRRSWARQAEAAIQPAHASILRALEIHAEVVRDRYPQKKPVRAVLAHWASRTAWAG